MLSDREIWLGILLPLAISAVLGALAWWRGWRWLIPIAAAAGFLGGYASSLGVTGGFGLPGWPPRDGTDNLFWGALIAGVLALPAALWPGRWVCALGLWAGAVVWAMIRPLTPEAVSVHSAIAIAVTSSLASVVIIAILIEASEHLGHGWVVLALAIILGGAGALVLSSNLRTSGVYGLGAGAAIAGLFLFAWPLKAGPAVAVLSSTILLGLLAAGRFYPDPGIGWISAASLLFAPAMILVGVALPYELRWARGLAAVLAVAILVGAVVTPAALAAIHAAESDPYSTAEQ